ncbi:MAG: AraC family transcriptional regulator [Clostridia bacterium]|nr:AraC family transcriptional regulator [Clostridia bacterium]
MSQEIFLRNKRFSDINPLLMGSERCAPNHSYGPATREYYLIHYVVSGCGRFFAENETYDVKAGKIFIIRPYEVTTYTADRTNPWHYIWVGFNGEIAKMLDDIKIPVLPYRENTFLDLLSCDKNNMREETVVSKLFEIISNIFDDEGETARYEQLAYDFISSNYMRHIKIEEIAGQLGVNRQYLSRLFKAQYGLTMQDFLIKTRINYAERLLKKGYSVAESAYMVGYEDVFNFSKMFKKHKGLSPSKINGTVI